MGAKEDSPIRALSQFLFIRDKNFYKAFFLMALPIILQNVISLSVNLADNLMLGRYGEASLSGVTAVNQIQFVYQNVLIGIGDGMVILAAQYWGKNRGNLDPLRKLASISMHTGFLAMVLLFTVVSLAPDFVVGLFTEDEEIIQEGVRYLKIVRFSYPFFLVTSLLMAALRGVEDVKIAVYLSLSTLVINCCINWLLIYGNWGFPRLGVQGAAIGTLVARVVEFVIILFYVREREKNLKLKMKDFLHIDRRMARDYYRICLPMILLKSLWGLNNALQTAILGHLSSAAIAANSMASNLYLIVKTVAVGAAQSANVQIGKMIGHGDEKEARVCSRTLQIMFVIMGILCGLLLLLLTEPILSLYSFSEEARYYARSFMHILCFIMAGMCYQMPTNSGIVKAGGDTKYIMKLDLISIWGIVIPLSFVAAFVLKASPIVVVWCLNLDQIFKGIPAFIKVNYGKWMHNLTR